MAPKVKKDKLTEEAIQQICFEYMVAQNRPYNATDVALNCHEQFTKAAAQKALQALADRDEIVCKNLAKDGKSTTLVFCARQDQDKTLSAEELGNLSEKLESLRQEVIAIVDKNKVLAQELAQVCSTKTTEELETESSNLDQKILDAKGTLDKYKTGARKMYSAEEVAKIDKQYEFFRKAHKKHKKEFENVFATLCEGMEKSKQESLAWREELGIDEVEEEPRYQWIEDPMSRFYKRVKTDAESS